MPIDLAAAAKRRRTGDYSPTSQGLVQHGLDVNMLADAMAAELDDTPLTAEAITAICGPADFTGLRVTRWNLPGETKPELRFMRELGRTVLTTYDADASEYHCRTQGALRTTMRLAGIQVTNTEPIQ